MHTAIGTTAPDANNILKVVLGGVATRNGYMAMPSFATQLSDQQIADIANYVRTSRGNSAPANVTPLAVQQLRPAARAR